ncbi:MAG: hypothetical protein GC151_16405 [Betaproteobacteria bacterium]|nr:hypothetical protein [Betaproteobacteria bacterium]
MQTRKSLSGLLMLMVFTIIQVWAPLLHAHTRPADQTVRGIHLPDAGVVAVTTHHIADHGIAHERCSEDEGAIVTAPAELRRDYRVALLPPVDAAPLPVSALHVEHRPELPTGRPLVARIHASIDAAPPYPQGPPALA